jgi:hypothetical protein
MSHMIAVNPIEAPFLSRASVPLGFTQTRHDGLMKGPDLVRAELAGRIEF